MVIITVKESLFLIAMHPIIGRVKIKYQLIRHLIIRGNEFFHKNLCNLSRRLLRSILFSSLHKVGGEARGIPSLMPRSEII